MYQTNVFTSIYFSSNLTINTKLVACTLATAVLYWYDLVFLKQPRATIFTKH